jgi:hypothetical protein
VQVWHTDSSIAQNARWHNLEWAWTRSQGERSSCEGASHCLHLWQRAAQRIAAQRPHSVQKQAAEGASEHSPMLYLDAAMLVGNVTALQVMLHRLQLRRGEDDQVACLPRVCLYLTLTVPHLVGTLHVWACAALTGEWCMRWRQLLMEEYWHSNNATVALDYGGVLFSTVSATSSPCEIEATPQPLGHMQMCHTATHTCPVRCVAPSPRPTTDDPPYAVTVATEYRQRDL